MSDLVSPPYPSWATPSKSLYLYLGELHQWVKQQLSILNDEVPDQVAKLSRLSDIQPHTVWEGVSVADKYTVLVHTRHVRESWDAVFRDHEDAWDSNMSLYKRLLVVKSAMQGIEEAFVDPETREARAHSEDKQAERRLKLMRDAVTKVLTAGGVDPDEFVDE